MPPTRHVAKEQSSPATPKIRQHFNLPSDSHLLITTPSYIFAWDPAGLHTIFRSSKSGIVVAREAKDGSGVLAIANKHVVVLHDTKREQEESWGLNADEDEIRHLEYTQDAKCLFLSTNLTNDIQRWSTVRSRLLSPAQAHHSAPVALALSPTDHLMVSASDDPPTVYLKNLAHNSSPVLVEPRASKAAVCVATFHPERPNIFLLAFRDGTLAAYDGTRVSRRQQRSFSDQETFSDGEIAHFTSLHRTTSKAVTKDGISSRAASIAGAAFLQGYKTRAISIGSDGRCRLVDFTDGGIILRTWHAKAPLTSVSVISIRAKNEGDGRLSARSRTSATSHTIGGPTSTNNIIAVGRADGKVHIYDSVGLLLAQKTISDSGERVISVEWAKGPSPRPIVTGDGQQDATDVSLVPVRKATPKRSPAAKPTVSVPPKSQARRSSTPHRLGLPPDLQRPDFSAQKRSARGDRRFTIHPDEAEEGTVRHTPVPKQTNPVPVQAGTYVDLFSPVKSPSAGVSETYERHTASSPRTRPRISSQTFTKKLEADVRPAPDSTTKPASHELFPPTESHATSTESETAQAGNSKTAKPRRVRRVSTNISPLKERTTSFKPVQRQTTRVKDAVAVPPNENAKVLADLRKMSGALLGRQPGVVPAAFTSKKPKETPPIIQNPLPAPRVFGASDAGRDGLGKQKYWHPGNVLEREATWITDSMQDESLHEDEEDIWLTDEPDKEAKRLRSRRLAPLKRPPARQTSRSRVDSKGTFSTVGEHHSPQTTSGPPIHVLDGSTEDDQYGTAHTHLSPVGVFTPSSADVRELFPRSSSLSPKRKRSPGKRGQRSPRNHARALQEITGNTVPRQPVSPWIKAKAVKGAQSPTKSPVRKQAAEPIQVRDDSVLATARLVRSPSIRCFKCVDTASRVSDLEDEVARLKGEVLGLKAALRRNGIAHPASARVLR